MDCPATRELPQGDSEAKFAFGKNWARFLLTINDERIEAARQSLLFLLRREDLRGTRFLDAGCGSGLFSLAAHRAGAKVTSIDVDGQSVACTQELKRRFAADAETWTILNGSILDGAFLQTLGTFDVVYSWGVVHHTGDMWTAIDHLVPLVREQGRMVLAIYNDQQYISRAWRGVKKIYQRLPRVLRPGWVAGIGLAIFFKRLIVTVLASLLRLLTFRNPFKPFSNWLGESRSRGMHAWYDLVDWVGGWPFEVARPEEVFRFLRDRGFTLAELTTSNGHGCNEFVFVKDA